MKTIYEISFLGMPVQQIIEGIVATEITGGGVNSRL
jgi:hypothetical protein